MSSVSPRDLETVVKNVVQSTPAFDLWTEMGPEQENGRLDRLLTQPELLAQYRQTCGEIPDGLSIRSVADQVWSGLFVQNSPLTENCRVVLTTLNRIGMRECVQSRSLERMRDQVNQLSGEAWAQALRSAANVERIGTDVTCTHHPLAPHIEAVPFANLNTAAPDQDLSAARYCVLDLRGDLDPERTGALLDRAAAANLAVLCEVQDAAALPLLAQLAPRAGVRWLLSAAEPSLYPVLSAAARQHHNVRVAGRWQPTMHQLYELTRTHLDLFGTACVHGYTKSCVPEHLVGRWVHLRSVLVNVLCEKYRVLIYTGWNLTQDNIERDVLALLQPAV